MNFKLTEDQKALQDAVRRLVLDESSRQQLRGVIDGKASWDEPLWEKLKAFGSTGMIVPEAYDGSGLTMVELALTAEMLGYAGAAVPFLGHALATVAVIAGGDEAQKARWLPGLASGETLATVALSERNDAWDPCDWRLAPDGAHITGRKINVPHGQLADLFIVGLEGGQLAVVETGGGVSVEPMDGLDLTRPLSAVEFTQAEVTLLANGVEGATRLRDASLVLLAADAFGGAKRILEMARDYSLVRETFGAVLAQRQAVKHQLANMELETEPTRGLYWFSAYTFDKWVERSSHAAALAKAHAAEMFIASARLGTELHGGIGFTWDYDSQIWLKRAMFDFAWGGRPDRLFNRAADLAGW
ncbi:acyl-CoA dehydrogenase family protein [Phenylobacterium sp.]|uniref:acyl-CoA dehydrogenase family protein n=1 Tax=Phenylobacterium sp. TaxID=1871053 RepID=UPI002899CF26|nr:acyl-CoA dehydrogenase family protein [Phenylobacterium sp.]